MLDMLVYWVAVVPLRTITTFYLLCPFQCLVWGREYLLCASSIKYSPYFQGKEKRLVGIRFVKLKRTLKRGKPFSSLLLWAGEQDTSGKGESGQSLCCWQCSCLLSDRRELCSPEGNQQAEVVIDPVGELLGCFKTKLSAQHLRGNMLMVKKI